MSTATQEPRTLPRLKQRYRDEIVGRLREDFGYGNVMQVPGLTKIVVNMGVGEAARDSKLIDGAVRDLWEFLDRLLSIALPRIRDFRGLDARKLDGHGNYTFGLTEQYVFHEIDQDKTDRVRGMDITVVTTAGTDDEGRALLTALGFPFREN